MNFVRIISVFFLAAMLRAIDMVAHPGKVYAFPAMDYLNKIADTTADISAGATSTATAVAMNQSGLVEGLCCNVIITEASAADFDTSSPRQLHFYFEVTFDNSIYHKFGVAPARVGAAGVPLQAIEIPVGLQALTTMLSGATAANVKWRVTANWDASLASADDFTYRAYLGPGIGANLPTLDN